MALTQAEKTFFSRMVPYILAGKSFAQAGQAVLDDDERIWLAAMEKSEEGAAIRAELAAEVYESIKGGNPAAPN